MKTPSRILIALSIVACSKGSEPSIAQQTQPSTAANVSESRRTAITSAVAAVAPAVVTVQTTVVEQVNPDLLSQMFGARPSTRVTPGLGTGFIVRNDGVIVTNAHVIAGADSISVMLRDGKIYPAKKLGVDETNDVAVLKIDGKNLPALSSAIRRRCLLASGRSRSATRTASCSATASRASPGASSARRGATSSPRRADRARTST